MKKKFLVRVLLSAGTDRLSHCNIQAKSVRALSSLEAHTLTGQEAKISLQYSKADGMSQGMRSYGKCSHWHAYPSVTPVPSD